jgi:hypothetical protein
LASVRKHSHSSVNLSPPLDGTSTTVGGKLITTTNTTTNNSGEKKQRRNIFHLFESSSSSTSSSSKAAKTNTGTKKNTSKYKHVSASLSSKKHGVFILMNMRLSYRQSIRNRPWPVLQLRIQLVLS